MRHIFSLDVQLSESIKHDDKENCYTAKMLYVAQLFLTSNQNLYI